MEIRLSVPVTASQIQSEINPMWISSKRSWNNSDNNNDFISCAFIWYLNANFTNKKRFHKCSLSWEIDG